MNVKVIEIVGIIRIADIVKSVNYVEIVKYVEAVRTVKPLNSGDRQWKLTKLTNLTVNCAHSKSQWL